MNSKNNCKFAVLPLLLSTLAPVIGQAATPTAMLEKGAVYSLGNEVRAFQIPTVDSLGKIRYYDITVKLTVSNTGQPAAIADVFSSLSPAVTTKVLVPGTYKSANGLTLCTVTNITLTNGRIQSFLSCTYNTNTKFGLSVATGPVASGHPYLADLVNAGINQLSDVDTKTWGEVTNGSFYADGCGSYGAGYPIGAVTDGKTLILSVYKWTSPTQFYCSGTFTKQP